ncbi:MULTISPECIES: hypothetical protein [unclassified Acinetobacter]|uniref:hypothetical protein n=1 Tax=unclassified Acinetobacter TaxID=196816 RepID=UPI0015D3FD2E|nr:MULTISPECIES: hypothetical protein [unclassified Acinetobacter]
MSNKTKQELIEKATGWALAIFFYGTGIFFFASKVLQLTGDDLDAYVSLISAGSTLFAGFIAIYLFNDWRDQKKFEIGKEYGGQILELVNNINKELSISFYRMTINKTMDKFLIALNGIYKESDFNLTDELYKISAIVETLSLITTDSEIEAVFQELETKILILKNSIGIVENSYKKYYEVLPERLKNNNTNNYVDKNGGEFNGAIYIYEKNFKTTFEGEIKIEIQEGYKKEFITHNETFEKYKENYDEAYKNMIKKITELMKIN